MNTPAVVDTLIIIFVFICFIKIWRNNRSIDQKLKSAQKEISALQNTEPRHSVVNNIAAPKDSKYLILMVILLTIVVNVLVYVVTTGS